MIRTTAPYGKPYRFDFDSVGQCTWYCYFRAIEEFGEAPCWYNGSGDKGTGYYRNAKYWANHLRGNWVLKSLSNYDVVHGDIIIYDGTYGHVAFVEEVYPNGNILLSNYNRIENGKFTLKFWTCTVDSSCQLKGCGKVLGVAHLNSNISTAPNSTNKNYITTNDAITKMAEDVIAGKYGNGYSRQVNIYNAIQKRVNLLLSK